MANESVSKKPITIDAVAAAAGVSTMTVSRVLRGSDSVAEHTRLRVEACIDELGYVYNRLAGALAASQGTQIAVIVPTLDSIVFTELLAGVTAGLNETGYQAVIGISEYDLHRELNMVRSMLGWRPAAFILANSRHLPKTRQLLESQSCPIVEVMELHRNPIDICVGLNQRKAGMVMARHLLAKGYKRFAYLGSDHSVDRAASLRYAGFEAELHQHQLTFIEKHMVEDISGISLGREHMSTVLQSSTDLDVVYFSNDAVAAGAMMHCQAAGINVPEDIALASFSGLEIASALPIPITTVRSPRFEMGELSAKRVLARLRGDKVTRVTDMGFELIEGKSA